MNGWTIMFKFGFCGWGFYRGIPELCLGVLRVSWCRGWIWDAINQRLHHYRYALNGLARKLGL